MGQAPDPRKKPNIQGFSGEKNRQKMLDKGVPVWYISQARLPERADSSAANLENDTESKRVIKGKISEDSKEFSIERC